MPWCEAFFDATRRVQIPATSAAGAVATRDFRYQGDSIVEEKLTDAGHPTGAVVRSYVTDADDISLFVEGDLTCDKDKVSGGDSV